MGRFRLRRFRENEVRKRFALILGGKMIGLVSIIGLMKGLGLFAGDPAGAAPAQAAQVADNLISPINTMWVLVAAFLVFFMQAGFMALEAGFARSRESVNIMMECIFDTCLCGLLYWAIGFAFQFGPGNGLIGHKYFFLSDAPATYDYGGLFDTRVAFLAFFLFQFAFADTASTITSGAMVGRTSFKGDIIYSACVSGLIYPIFGHWVWGPGGWLGNTMGWFQGLVPDGTVFRDFAGSTVVHTVGGFIALAGAIALGPRLGRKFTRDGGGPTQSARPEHRRDRRRHPVVRLVRVQPRLDPLGHGLRGHRPGRGQHHARGVRGRHGRGASSSTPARRSGTWGWRSTASSEAWSASPPRATGCHRSVP